MIGNALRPARFPRFSVLTVTLRFLEQFFIYAFASVFPVSMHRVALEPYDVPLALRKKVGHRLVKGGLLELDVWTYWVQGWKSDFYAL